MIDDSLTRLHVVGCPRSGTTLMMEMLVACYHHDAHCDHEETFFKVPPINRGLYISKQPNDINWIRPVAEKDRSAFFVAMIRDPRSVVCSRHSGHDDMYFCNYRVWKRAEQSLEQLRDLPNVAVVRFEDLVTSPDTVQERLEEQFPFLERKHLFSEYHQHARASAGAIQALGGVRPVTPGASEGWKRHLPRLKQQVVDHAGLLDDLVRLGYEQDSEWAAMLADVKAERYKCRYPERPTPLKDMEVALRVRRKRARYLRMRGLG